MRMPTHRRSPRRLDSLASLNLQARACRQNAFDGEFMSQLNRSAWSLVALGAASAWVLVGMLAQAHRRKTVKLMIAQDLQEWENEGGAPPAVEIHSS